MDDDLRPAALIAADVGVSRQLVYWWIRSGKLPQAGTAPNGRALYSRRAAAEVDKATSRSPYSHRVTSAA